MAKAEVEESAHPTGRTGARLQRIELISRRERHRRWAPERKRAMVEEMLAPGARPTDVARKYEISTSQLYTWRRLLRDGKLDDPASAPQFLRVNLVAAPRRVELAAPATAEAMLTSGTAQPASDNVSRPARRSGTIEIELSCGTRVRVDAEVDGRALGRVLSVLGSR
jgi:transposase